MSLFSGNFMFDPTNPNLSSNMLILCMNNIDELYKKGKQKLLDIKNEHASKQGQLKLALFHEMFPIYSKALLSLYQLPIHTSSASNIRRIKRVEDILSELNAEIIEWNHL